MVELFEDGVAWLVDGEDYSFTSSGQSRNMLEFFQKINRWTTDMCLVPGINSRTCSLSAC